jgi:hypothetical protein
LQHTLNDSRRALRRIEDVPAGLAAHLLLELGLKPCMRELHHVEKVQEAEERWRELGYETCRGEEISEDQVTYALLSKENAEYTVRPLAKHPIIERLLAVGGRVAHRVLLDERSPLYRRLADHFEADQVPVHAHVDHDDSERVHRRCTLYVAKDMAVAESTRSLDRMAVDSNEDHTEELGDALGYPSCCVKAYISLERRWPNRLPIQAAASRTRRYHARLNNVCLKRFTWISHFPCRYDCEESLALANAAAEQLSEINPQLVQLLDNALGMPRVYFHDDRQAVLVDARRSGREMNFEAAVSLGDFWPNTHTHEDSGLERATSVTLVERPEFQGSQGPIKLSQPPLILPFKYAG